MGCIYAHLQSTYTYNKVHNVPLLDHTPDNKYLISRRKCEHKFAAGILGRVKTASKQENHWMHKLFFLIYVSAFHNSYIYVLYTHIYVWISRFDGCRTTLNHSDFNEWLPKEWKIHFSYKYVIKIT